MEEKRSNNDLWILDTVYRICKEGHPDGGRRQALGGVGGGALPLPYVL